MIRLRESISNKPRRKPIRRQSSLGAASDVRGQSFLPRRLDHAAERVFDLHRRPTQFRQQVSTNRHQ
jgi:hypothetical protein